MRSGDSLPQPVQWRVKIPRVPCEYFVMGWCVYKPITQFVVLQTDSSGIAVTGLVCVNWRNAYPDPSTQIMLYLGQ